MATASLAAFCHVAWLDSWTLSVESIDRRDRRVHVEQLGRARRTRRVSPRDASRPLAGGKLDGYVGEHGGLDRV